MGAKSAGIKTRNARFESFSSRKGEGGCVVVKNRSQCVESGDDIVVNNIYDMLQVLLLVKNAR